MESHLRLDSKMKIQKDHFGKPPGPISAAILTSFWSPKGTKMRPETMSSAGRTRKLPKCFPSHYLQYFVGVGRAEHGHKMDITSLPNAYLVELDIKSPLRHQKIAKMPPRWPNLGWKREPLRGLSSTRNQPLWAMLQLEPPRRHV